MEPMGSPCQGTSEPADLGDFPRLGLSLAGLREFVSACGGRKAIESMTTDQVVTKWVKPATEADSGASWCAQNERAGFVGVADTFVSHAWAYPFLEVVDALECWEAETMEHIGAVYWFDAFANCQHTAPARSHDWWSNVFKQAIKAIGRVVLVLQTDDPIPLTRSWCLWEIACATEAGVAFDVALSAASVTRLREMLMHDSDSLLCRLSSIDLRLAQARAVSDRESINVAVEAGPGFDAVNATVVSLLRSWILRRAEVLAQAEPDGEDKPRLLCCVAHWLTICGRPEDALPLLRGALQVVIEKHGFEAGVTLQCRSRLAIASAGMDSESACDWELSELRDIAAAKQTHKDFGPSHPSTLRSLYELYNLEARLSGYFLQEYRAAEIRELVQRMSGAPGLGPESTDTLAARALYARSLGPTEAVPYLRDVVAAASLSLGKEDVRTLQYTVQLAECLSSPPNSDRGREALQLYEASYNSFTRLLGPSHPAACDIAVTLSCLYSDLCQQWSEKASAKSGPKTVTTSVNFGKPPSAFAGALISAPFWLFFQKQQALQSGGSEWRLVSVHSGAFTAESLARVLSARWGATVSRSVAAAGFLSDGVAFPTDIQREMYAREGGSARDAEGSLCAISGAPSTQAASLQSSCEGCGGVPAGEMAHNARWLDRGTIEFEITPRSPFIDLVDCFKRFRRAVLDNGDPLPFIVGHHTCASTTLPGVSPPSSPAS